jgi:multidrug transporter EmrE-like cation transporter
MVYKWLLSFLGFPLGGLIAYLIVGSVMDLFSSALSGLIVGLVVGAAQWLVLRKAIPISYWWILFSGVGVAFGLSIGMLMFGTSFESSELMLRGAIIGFCLGIVQWLLLKQHVRFAGAWIIAISISWPLGLLTTKGAGIDLSIGWAVFGASGALLFSSLTYLVLRFVHRVKI